ncbi:MAG: hypoxanthine phosphoribosyltransferase [Dehalococcoidales bacterium]|jgi:hypoxanthine phosphoribosyltransferase|nr:hypoxanthine phosphoribosyltransferase [Dehalococcoidales bacterium]MDD3264322.1 hypoxanthine phosphoribosyltransferase [Dehalococcoidales bacterium]MDD4322057.1 hypoxanthine phosphoribosyltransferase [Dehalococcoidales bacterium]MDD4793628.1 hypoxanthine phosphoribosyltransferase [Dehalococcoidales bacterium]MDD5122003.1 hypoxanthine phosphoribosyltransferase [Dehalococcoidales bacterium]
MSTCNRKKSSVFVSAIEIEKAIDSMADAICNDYKNKKLVLIGVLKGSFIFLADLVRKLDIDAEIDFIGLSSYGSDRVSSGTVTLYFEPRIEIMGRDVLLVEDIIDSGLSTTYAIGYLKSKGAKSVRLCSLLDKKSRRETEVTIDYSGFTAPDGFLVGYGLDCDEHYRNLNNIIILGEE